MSELNAHPSVKAYCQHGFIPTGESGTEIFGACPFCGKQNRLYVNKKSKAWDCKHCEKHGGFLTFLEEITSLCKDNFTGANAIKLAKSRGVSLNTLRKFDLGFNAVTNSFCFPVRGPDGKRVNDVRMYKNGKLISTATCKTGLLNWDKIPTCKGTIWLCEGEWDGMAMQEILDKLGMTDDVATAVPGAGTFKAVWVPFFTGRKVFTLYDNDEAGQKGALKIFNALIREAKELKFVNWTSEYTNNFDLRDLYMQQKGAKKTLETLVSLLRDLPMNADVESITRDGANSKTKYDGNGLSAEQVYTAYKQWLHLPDTSVIDVMYGTIIANRLDGDPLWLFLVAPPGMTKTSLLQTVVDAKDITSVSTLTPHSLISGSNAGGIDPSLIPQLNNRVLIIKDFTTILNMNQQAREEIFGTLRDAYDGEIAKTFGHGVRRHYVSKFGIIAGVTPAIETFLANESALGERFLRFAMKLPATVTEHLAYMRRATANIQNDSIMKSSLRDVGAQVLNYAYSSRVEIPEHIYTRILYLSMWTAQLRGTIIRDKFSKEVMFKPFQELGTRLSKQFIKLLLGIGMFRRLDTVGENEFEIIRNLALGTVPSRLEDCVCRIYKEGKDRHFTIGEIGEMIRLPNGTTQQVVNSLYMLGVLQKSRMSGLKTDWQLSDAFLKLIRRSGVYK